MKSLQWLCNCFSVWFKIQNILNIQNLNICFFNDVNGPIAVVRSTVHGNLLRRMPKPRQSLLADEIERDDELERDGWAANCKPAVMVLPLFGSDFARFRLDQGCV